MYIYNIFVLNKMDKRYFLIIIIIFVGCINLYMITEVSDVVGSASVNVGKYTFTLPNGFSLYDTNTNDIMISNPNSNMKVYVYSSLDKKDTYENKSAAIAGNYKVLSNGTIKYDDMEIHSIYYQNRDSSRKHATFFFTKYNNTFRILINDFDYGTQKNETIDIATGIADSMRINYKI